MSRDVLTKDALPEVIRRQPMGLYADRAIAVIGDFEADEPFGPDVAGRHMAIRECGDQHGIRVDVGKCPFHVQSMT